MQGFLAGMLLGVVVVAFGMAVVSENSPMPAGRSTTTATVAGAETVTPEPASVIAARGPDVVRPPAGVKIAESRAEEPADATSVRPVLETATRVGDAAAEQAPVARKTVDPIMDLPLAAVDAPSPALDVHPPVVDAAAPDAPAMPAPAAAVAVAPAAETTTSPGGAAPGPVAAPRPEAGPSLAEMTAPPPTSGVSAPAVKPVEPPAAALAPVEDAPTTIVLTEPGDAPGPAVVATKKPATIVADKAGNDAPAMADTPRVDPVVVLPVPNTPPARGIAPATVAVAEPTPGPAPTPGLDGSVDGVTVGRLPRIGVVEPVSDAAELVVPDVGSNPLADFARPFDNPDGKPGFAIILIDQGLSDDDRDQLALLPFPVTFALDPTMPQAAAAEAAYRAAGQEVAMLATGIPQGASAADLEVTFESHARSLPEAVVVLDLEVGGFQTSRPLAMLVVPVIGGQGRGVLTWDGGLNAVEQVAQRDGVASGTVFRRFDPEGASVQTIRRNLDRAAFKAAQDGKVIVVGNASAAMTAALLAWSLEGRASTVALAPVSAVLTKPAG